MMYLFFFFFLFFNDTATTEIYTLSLHDALPISVNGNSLPSCHRRLREERTVLRSEEHTSELQSPCNLVCRLLLAKNKKKRKEDYNVNTLVRTRESAWLVLCARGPSSAVWTPGVRAVCPVIWGGVLFF